MLDKEVIYGVLFIFGIAAVFGIILNPYFWQSFRNAKYWDTLNDSSKAAPEDDTKDITP